jgi:hypothetical protein
MRMRRYDDQIEVRAGIVDGMEGPAQFVWRDQLWQVRAVVGHWVDTAPWWHQPAVQGLLGIHEDDGAADANARPAPVGSVASLVAERDVWRVEASRGRLGTSGVFELVHDGTTGQWRLTGCED